MTFTFLEISLVSPYEDKSTQKKPLFDVTLRRGKFCVYWSDKRNFLFNFSGEEMLRAFDRIVGKKVSGVHDF